MCIASSATVVLSNDMVGMLSLGRSWHAPLPLLLLALVVMLCPWLAEGEAVVEGVNSQGTTKVTADILHEIAAADTNLASVVSLQEYRESLDDIPIPMPAVVQFQLLQTYYEETYSVEYVRKVAGALEEVIIPTETDTTCANFTQLCSPLFEQPTTLELLNSSSSPSTISPLQEIQGSRGACCVSTLLGRAARNQTNAFNGSSSAHCMREAGASWSLFRLAPRLELQHTIVIAVWVESIGLSYPYTPPDNCIQAVLNTTSPLSASQAKYRAWLLRSGVSGLSGQSKHFMHAEMPEIACVAVHTISSRAPKQTFAVDTYTYTLNAKAGFAARHEPPTLQGRFLLVPSSTEPHSEPLNASHLANWLLLDDEQVDLDGRSCDKVGLTHKRFWLHASKSCATPRRACLGHQPDDLLALDKKLEQRGMDPKFKLNRVGVPFATNFSATPAINSTANSAEQLFQPQLQIRVAPRAHLLPSRSSSPVPLSTTPPSDAQAPTVIHTDPMLNESTFFYSNVSYRVLLHYTSLCRRSSFTLVNATVLTSVVPPIVSLQWFQTQSQLDETNNRPTAYPLNSSGTTSANPDEQESVTATATTPAVTHVTRAPDLSVSLGQFEALVSEDDPDGVSAPNDTALLHPGVPGSINVTVEWHDLFTHPNVVLHAHLDCNGTTSLGSKAVSVHYVSKIQSFSVPVHGLPHKLQEFSDTDVMFDTCILRVLNDCGVSQGSHILSITVVAPADLGNYSTTPALPTTPTTPTTHPLLNTGAQWDLLSTTNDQVATTEPTTDKPTTATFPTGLGQPASNGTKWLQFVETLHLTSAQALGIAAGLGLIVVATLFAVTPRCRNSGQEITNGAPQNMQETTVMHPDSEQRGSLEPDSVSCTTSTNGTQTEGSANGDDADSTSLKMGQSSSNFPNTVKTATAAWLPPHNYDQADNPVQPYQNVPHNSMHSHQPRMRGRESMA
eukprot:m.49370 g.49370  ORF g.49370 m.49370 type:complete len:956 (-) comp11090_c0_seq1:1880-4747(-)